MENDNEILERLHAIPDKEWVDIIDKLTRYVFFKLKAKTLFGAHSEENLGIDPINYYVDTAIEKLFSLEWKWQFEKFTILEQLQRIVGSLISANVEKYKTAKENQVLLVDNEVLAVIADKLSDDEYNDEQYELFKEALHECSKDDDELQFYVMALEECNSFDEMEEVTGFEKSKLYVLQKKMTRRIKSYLTTRKETVK
ncbi:MAG: hypothetical protein ACLTWE_08030 [Dysgonomonas mossii]|uniref:hypothetical protein n=1 Tax=Dysgonomonas mossii TaxID=163665 RepID=UPI0039940738